MNNLLSRRGRSASNQSYMYLLHEEESYALKHLISVECRDGHVEKESVQNGGWNVGQWIGQEEERQADEEV